MWSREYKSKCLHGPKESHREKWRLRVRKIDKEVQ